MVIQGDGNDGSDGRAGPKLVLIHTYELCVLFISNVPST